ncbi:MAG: heparinase II/III family protein [Candidatus Latescibacteria bacterium]|nr:heparinase II/III family protein [Candidatus Latescibacterota bacterium]
MFLCALPSPDAGLELPAEQHPSLLFTADEVPLLKERIQRAPYSTWWTTTLKRADAAAGTFAEERAKVRSAKSLAFAYAITGDTTYARRGVELLADTKFPPRGGDMGQPHLEGEIAAQYAQSYDLLHTYLQGDTTSLELIRTLLAEEAQRLYAGIRIKFGFLSIRLHQTPDPRDLSVVHLDNWHLRAYAGLGLAAFALADHPGLSGSTPEQWAERAYDLVTRTLDYQVEGTDGGYAEGPFYHRYAADVYLPYMWALKGLTGTDLFATPKVQKLHDWSLNLRLPSGRRPNIDDSHLDDFYGHYLAGLDADGGEHRWDWEQDEPGLYVREFSELDAIALYDDRVPAREPARGPTIFMPEAGDAVFRSDWSKAATYLLLRGEHGLTRSRGLGHEHPDETSFVLYAGGEMLALDAGYIDFEFHQKVNGGRNHNVVLVDGEGPPLVTLLGQPVDGGEDAFIEDYFTSSWMDYAEVRAAYQGVQVRRRVMFPGKRYFLIADQLSGDQVHTYEWRLHGNGGGTSGGTYSRSGNLARWTRSGAELLAFLPELPGQTFSEVDTLHSFDYLQELTHTVLRAQQRGQEARFLALLYPRPTGQAEPELSSPPGGQVLRLALEEQEDWAWTSAGDTVAFETPAGPLRSDAHFGLVRFSGAQPRALNVQDGHFLQVGEKLLFSSAEEGDLSLELEAAAGDTTQTGATPEPSADFDGSGQVNFADFFLFVDAFGKTDSRFDLDRSGQVDFADFFLFVDAFGKTAGAD